MSRGILLIFEADKQNMRVILILITIMGALLAVAEELGYDYYINGQQVGMAFAFVQGAILLFRAVKRWTTVKYFTTNEETVLLKGLYTKEVRKQVIFSRAIEASLLFAVGIGLALLSDSTALLGRVMLYAMVENLIYIAVNNRPNRFGFIVNKQAILSFTDKQQTYKWEDVKMIEEKYGELFFSEKNDVVTVFPLNEVVEGDKIKVLEIIREQGIEQGFGEVEKTIT